MTQHFIIEEHVLPGQHIRGYYNALKTHQEDVVEIAIKHYLPKEAAPPTTSLPSITIVAGHGNGFPKEMYEPVWDDLFEITQAHGFHISGIWFADNAHQGESGVGDDVSWFDHSRDLLHMINHFRSSMTRPIFGFAHSMGCAQLVHLSILHPRLLSGLIMIEPVIQAAPKGPNAGMLAALRPDLWTNRQEAAAPLRKSRTFKAWDKRVLDKYVQNMFRETPTALYPDGGKVTLKTTKHQESWSYNRGNFWPRGDMEFDRRLDPDLVGKPAGEMMFFRTESLVALSELPHVLPPVFWVFGGKSFLSPKEWITEKVETTGIGMGGSGGLGAGKVQHVVYDHGNHFVICERPKEVMKDVAAWLKNHGLAEFRKDESFWRERKTRKSKRDMLEVSDEWTKGVKEDASIKRPILAPGSKL